MTLIIGIKCRDGVVVGSDGAATFGALGQATIRQPVARKLGILSGKVIVGVSGPVGLGQRIAAEVEDLWDQGAFAGRQPVEAMVLLRQELFKHISVELQAAQVALPVIGNLALESALSATVVALPLGATPVLMQFNQQGAPELTSEQLPFVACGSGQPIADPFVAFLRRVLWPGRLPSIDEGILTAVWALDHAIETHPGGVANPVQLTLLRRDGEEFRALELTEQELGEHRQARWGAERALSGYLYNLRTPLPAGEVPPLPKP